MPSHAPIKYLPTVAEYNRHIRITPPRLRHLDCRSFGENMAHVPMKIAPFRHGHYALAWITHGTNREVMGEQLSGNVFFNAPYQIVTWDIDPDWEGYYVVFDDDFVREHLNVLSAVEEWMFFRADYARPVNLPPEDTAWFALTFKRLHAEVKARKPDAERMVGGYLHGMLDLVLRHFTDQHQPSETIDADLRDANYVNRFEALVMTDIAGRGGRGKRSVAHYASNLAVTPDQLTVITKRVTGESASGLLSRVVLTEAKRLLTRTDLQIQDISTRLGYSAPTHFNAFFRRATGESASAWRSKE